VKGAVKRIALEVVGWVLVLAGLAALVLPGPGLLLLAGGLIVLSQQYEWAERRVEPIKREAMKAAATSVQTWYGVAMSVAGICGLIAFGVLWAVQPDVPDWWPIGESWWLRGGLGVSISLWVSAAIALGLVVWSYRRFHGHPDAVAEVVAAAEADDDREHFFGS
jgi:hypothetical protein